MTPDAKTAQGLREELATKLSKVEAPSAKEALAEFNKRMSNVFANHEVSIGMVQQANERFEQWLEKNHPKVFNKLKGIVVKFVEKTRKEAGVEVSKSKRERPNISKRKEQLKKFKEGNKALAHERKEKKSLRTMRMKLRNVKSEWLKMKKGHYADLAKTSDPEKREEIFETIAAGDKESVEMRLAIYKDAKDNLKLKLSKQDEMDMKALDRLVNPENYEGEEAEEEPDILSREKEFKTAIAHMKAFKEPKLRIKPVVFEDFNEGAGVGADWIGEEMNDLSAGTKKISDNFNTVAKAQSKVSLVSAYLGAVLGDVMKGLGQAHSKTKSAGLLDWASKFSPWKTDNAKAFDSANKKLRDAKKALKKKYQPMIDTMISHQQKIQDAAETVVLQAGRLSVEAKEDRKNIKNDEKHGKPAKLREVRESGQQSLESQAEAYRGKVDDLKGAKEQRLKELARKKGVIKKASEGGEEELKEWRESLSNDQDVADNQAALYGKAQEGVEAKIKVLQELYDAKKANKHKLPDEKRQEILRVIMLLQGKEVGLERIKNSNDDLKAERIRIENANEGLDAAALKQSKTFANAYENVAKLENGIVMTFAEEMGALTDSFVNAKGLTKATIEHNLKIVELGFDRQIMQFDEMEDYGKELRGKAEVSALEIEVGHTAANQSITMQTNQIENSSEVGVTFLKSVYNSVTLTPAITWVAKNWFKWEEDHPAVKGEWGLNKVIEWPVKGLESWGIWKHIGDGYNNFIDATKGIPVVSSVTALVDVAANLGSAVYQIVAHPIDSVDGLVQLITSPGQWGDVGLALLEADEFAKGNYLFAGTKAIGNLALLFTPGALAQGGRTAMQALKLAKNAKAAEVAAQAAKATQAAGATGAAAQGVQAAATSATGQAAQAAQVAQAAASPVGAFFSGFSEGLKTSALSLPRNTVQTLGGVKDFFVNSIKLTGATVKGNLPETMLALRRAGLEKRIFYANAERELLVARFEKVTGISGQGNLASDIVSQLQTATTTSSKLTIESIPALNVNVSKLSPKLQAQAHTIFNTLVTKTENVLALEARSLALHDDLVAIGENMAANSKLERVTAKIETAQQGLANLTGRELLEAQTAIGFMKADKFLLGAGRQFRYDWMKYPKGVAAVPAFPLVFTYSMTRNGLAVLVEGGRLLKGKNFRPMRFIASTPIQAKNMVKLALAREFSVKEDEINLEDIPAFNISDKEYAIALSKAKAANTVKSLEPTKAESKEAVESDVKIRKWNPGAEDFENEDFDDDDDGFGGE